MSEPNYEGLEGFVWEVKIGGTRPYGLTISLQEQLKPDWDLWVEAGEEYSKVTFDGEKVTTAQLAAKLYENQANPDVETLVRSTKAGFDYGITHEAEFSTRPRRAGKGVKRADHPADADPDGGVLGTVPGRRVR